MRTLYFECAMGAAGDMLMGALYELCPEKERFLADMNALLPGVRLEAEAVRRPVPICGWQSMDRRKDMTAIMSITTTSITLWRILRP